MKKIVIVGGGASGLCCAINCKNDNNEVIVLEKNSLVGKKILVTGNGRCNFYNEDQNLKHYNSTSKIDDYITLDRIKKVLPFFESLGIIPDVKDGYYYPKSNQAVTVKNALELECLNKGIKIITDTEVLDIQKKDNEFIIKTNNDTYKADYVVISTGSKASLKTENNGYELAKKLGHKIIKVLPGLVQLVSNTKLKEASGVRVKTSLTLIEDEQKIKEEFGELQITDYGISGIVAMQLSSQISRGIDENKKEEIIINFLPGIENPKGFIESLNSRLQNRSINQILDNLLNYKLVNAILKICNITGDLNYDDLEDDKKQMLIKTLTSYKIKIDSTKDFSNAQICSGGVSLEELNTNFESKKVDNLYFTGEVIDVNGDCGGYNLTFAWLSAIVVGDSIKED